VASLVDTNVLVYRVDPRDAVKQRVATELLRDGISSERLFIAHQCVIEFVAAVTRPQKDLDGAPLLALSEAFVQAEFLMSQLPVLYPNRECLLTAIRGAATYELPWFDANVWACAEVNGLLEILSEDFQHGRHYGKIRAVDPFLAASGQVSELPALYSR
jgi:predicted nucleic acid-binding protein